MTNKESLREKFEKKYMAWSCDDFDTRGYEDMCFDFFWNEIEQIRKADMERVEDVLLEHFSFCDCEKDSDGNLACTCGGNISERDKKVLSIIKQSHE